MPKYRIIKTGAVIEVLEGTKIYEGCELVKDGTKKTPEVPKSQKICKKSPKKTNSEKKSKKTGVELEIVDAAERREEDAHFAGESEE